MCERVCVCVRERDKQRVCVRERMCVCERESESVCVCERENVCVEECGNFELETRR